MTLRIVQVPDPAPGTDWIDVVPGQYLYNVISATGLLTTTAAGSIAAYTTAQLTWSPTGYYHLDEAGPPTAADASGSGNNGTYDPFATGGVTYGVAGYVPGDNAVRWGNFSRAVAQCPLTAGIVAGDFFVNGWQDVPAATSGDIVDMRQAATSILRFGLDLLGANVQIHAVRKWGPGGGDVDSATVTAPNPGPGGHMWTVSYRAAFGSYVFYCDGAQFGAPVFAGVHAMTFAPTSAFVGTFGTPSGTTFDEIAYGPSAVTAAQVLALFEAATTGPGPQRQVTFAVTDGAHEVLEVPSGFAEVAGTGPYAYSWQVGLGSSAQGPSGTPTTVAIPPLVLPAGYTLGAQTLDLGVSDQWSNVAVWWDDNIMNAQAAQSAYLFPPPVHLVYHQEPS